MSLHLVKPPNYAGSAGVLQVKHLRCALHDALITEDWYSVRRLDQSCHSLIDRVISANKGNSLAISAALNELKDVYANLIVHCQHEVASLAH